MGWLSKLAIVVFVLGFSTQAYSDVVFETDDNAATFTGTWANSTSPSHFYGTDYASAQTGGSVDVASFKTQTTITSTASWCIWAYWTSGADRTTQAKYQVFDGTTSRTTFTVSQQTNGGAWRRLGCVQLSNGKTSEVRVSDTGLAAGNVVIADGVRWVLDERPLKDFCVAVNGGFGNGGTTFIGKGFVQPANNTCKPWSGIMKHATTVVGFSTGAGCTSSDGKVLTITLMTTARITAPKR